MQVVKKSGYMPSLDGWRAFSILAVLAAHSHTFYIGRHSLRWLQDFGGSGVYVFFAISGLLICSRLLEEEEVLGRINLRGFYIRRVLRIQPAAIAYLVAVAAVTLLGWFPQQWKYWFGALFLYRNFQLDTTSATVSLQGFLTGHFWTLSVEEHFYLLLSILLYFVLRRRKIWLTVALLVSLLWPLLSHRFFMAAYVRTAGRNTDVQLQFLLPAAWLAVMLTDAKFRGVCLRFVRPVPVIGGTMVLALLIMQIRAHAVPFVTAHPRIAERVLPMWSELYQRMFPLWILATTLHPRSFMTRFLELPPLRWIGRISYSLYLWHVLFFRGPWPHILPEGKVLLVLTREPWNLISALVCATLSFYLLERPLMRLGHRLAPPATPGRPDLAEPVNQTTGSVKEKALV